MFNPDFISDDLLKEFVRIIAHNLGLQIRPQDHANLHRKITQRAIALNLSTAQDYYRYLLQEENQGEWQQFAILLTNIESYFFRDQGQFHLLRHKIIPDLIKRKSGDRRLRVWSAGCSTGEEPYSLAILLQDSVPDIHLWDVEVVGSDINLDALAKAKQGRYGPWSFRILEQELQEKYFDHRDNGHQVRSPVKSLLNFQYLNLVQDIFPQSNGPIRNFDLILCRNVFIYFGHPAIAKVIQKFAQCLNPEGYLLTGHAELYGQNLSAFQVKLFPESVVYQKRSAHAMATQPPAPLHLSEPIVPPQTMPTVDFPWNTPPIAPLNPLGSSLPKVSRPPKTASTPKMTAPRALPQEQNPLPEAKILIQKKQYRQAIELLSPLVAADSSAELHFLLGQIYANLGDYQRAIAHCRQALSLDSLSVDPYYILAHIAEEQGDFPEAKKVLKKIIYLDPQAIAAYWSLGHIYGQEGDQQRQRKMEKTVEELCLSLSPQTQIPELGNLSVGDIQKQLKSL